MAISDSQMRRNRETLVRLTVLTALFLLAGAGCRDKDLMNHRRFVLTNIDGNALPALEHETVTGRYVALADTIVFTSATRGFQSRVYRVEPKIEQPAETIRTSTEFTYELGEYIEDSSVPSNTILVTYVCGDDALADCLAGPHLSGTMIGNALTLHILHLSPERERRYVER